MPLQAYLGGTQLFVDNSFLGATPVQLEGPLYIPPTFSVTGGLDVWIDAQQWSGTGNLNARVGNYTASLQNVTRDTVNGGIMSFQSSSILEISASGGGSINYNAFVSYSVVLIGRNSGSAALQHGRMLNSSIVNWLFGSYNENSETWYNGVFVYNSGVEDNQWRIYTGIQHSASSGSFYVNGSYKGGSTTPTQYGFNGLAINKGKFIGDGNPASGEYTYCDIGQILLYNRPLTQTEIGNIYTYFSGSYF